ncbi:esterase [Saccharopolyspora subtropica]|uniref:Esterase n=1 Tax=Saccharopolyspora thermophila TaxID=89367 RepID=A0A917NIS1_9PSEU|nr:patatin-like phospholipase family protein [Saccharopolyspora subtropica]GGJ03619.1 esterase [Saccharopolyspora subtropica]
MVHADLVLEGGGIKGLGTAGAVLRLLERGYTFPRIAGTSAGAVVAALAAAGADAPGLRRALAGLDLSRIPDRHPPAFPLISEGWALLAHSGAYRGDYLHDWLARELGALGVSTFGDLRRDSGDDDSRLRPDQRYKLVVLATDITRGRLLRLPWDYPLFHLDPDAQSVADAVRMSMSIPLYFQPSELTDPVTGCTSVVVDGAVLSNFPVEIFDRTDGRRPRWPTFGVRILPDLPENADEIIPALGIPLLPPFELLKRVLVTAFVGHDQTHLDRPGVRDRMIVVDTSGVGITEFDAPPDKLRRLLRRGRDAVDDFLARTHADLTAPPEVPAPPAPAPA